MKRRRSDRARAGLSALLACLALASIGTRAHAQAPAAESTEVVQARDEFVRGSERAKRAQWAEALQAFERSAKLRPHAVTTFNIGVCQRAMGNYTLARDSLLRAATQNQASGGAELADSLVAENQALLTQIDQLLATANVMLEPATATVTVDGRPLAARGEGASRIMVAGVREPGRGDPAPSQNFRLLLNPGVHVITLARPGFAEAVITRTLAPGSTTDLKLQLDRLPATMHVTSNEEGAVVTVNNVDVGVAPVDVSRPAGEYHVTVSKPGFKRYESDVTVRSGEELTLGASLSKYETPLTQRWWFWTVAGAVVVGAGVGTYALTRGESTVQEPLNGGGLGWTVKAR